MGSSVGEDSGAMGVKMIVGVVGLEANGNGGGLAKLRSDNSRLTSTVELISRLAGLAIGLF